MDELNDIFEELAEGASGVTPLGAAGATSDPADGATGSPNAAGGPGAMPEVAGGGAAPLVNIAAPLFGVTGGATSVLEEAMEAAAGTNNGRSSTAPSAGGGGIGVTLGTVGLDILKSGFGLLPILGGLFGLFGGGGPESLPPLVRYQMPEAVSYDAAEVDGHMEAGDYSQSGTPRGYGGSAATGITVNVQAMDSQSFLDRSSDIAAAVRQAMLNSNAINDLVGEL
jgi:hypothetical protein